MATRKLKTWKKLYKKALKEKNYDFIDQIIMLEIWGIKKVCRAYETWAKSMGYKDPMKADESYGLSITWAHEHLFGSIL